LIALIRVWLSSLSWVLVSSASLSRSPNLGLQLGVVGFVELRRGEGPLGLAGQGDQLVDGGDDLLDLHVSKLDGRQNDLFGLFLGARLDHHDAVLVADDHDVDGGGGALGVSGVDDELAIDAAHAHRAHRGAEGNVREGQGAAAALMAITSGSFSLSAEKTSAITCVSLRKPSGKSGRMGRSIWRQVSTSFSLGRPSRLMKPPGMRPPA
jgi:hypothetical protein